jgi:hypothetical protein
MTLSFRRRPFLMGNTPLSVLSQPYIRGQIRRDDTSRQFTGLTLPAELRLEIDGAPFTVALTGLDIGTIVSDINGVIGAVGLAREEDGYVTIYTNTIGAGASVTIMPGAGVVADATYFLGFPRSPDPLAHVESGDIAWSPPVGRGDNNPLGTGFIAGGERMTADAANRALFLLSRNTELNYQDLTRELARGMEIDVDTTVANWGARVITDGSGAVEQLNLSDLSPWPDLIERIYVGNGYASRLSSLTDIGKFFAVMRNDLVEIIVGGRAVRVAAVTHGQRLAPSPTFLDEVSPPTAPLANVSNWPALDGTNLLGVDCIKTAAVAIDEVHHRTTVRVVGATFIADGVVAGDKAVIAGSVGDDPFNHDGTYRVESVIDEEHLTLTAWESGERGELNPNAGTIGTLTVSSGSLFADDVWLTFEPPVPSGVQFKVIVGAGVTLKDLPQDYLLRMTIRSFDEVDDLVQEVIRKMKGPLVDSTDDFTAAPFAHSIPGGAAYAGEPDVTMEMLWRRITLQGAYDGQGRASGGGFLVEVDDRPPRWQANNPKTPQPGTVLRAVVGSTAQILPNSVFFAPGEAFTLGDVGRDIIISGAVPGGIDPFAQFTIIDYLDSEMVVLSEEVSAVGPIPQGAVENYSIVEGRLEGWTAAFEVQVVEQVNDTARWGYIYFEDMNPDAPYDAGHAHASLREAARHSGDATALRYFDVTFGGGDDWVDVGFDPLNSGNIRFGVDAVSGEFRPGGYINITHSMENAGWFHVIEAEEAGGVGRLRLQNLDGSTPNFVAGDAKAHLYHATDLDGERVALNLMNPAMVQRRLGKFLYDDGYDASDLLGVLGIGWRGLGSGVWMNLNDPSFTSLQRWPDATRGPAFNITTYNPAVGYVGSHYGAPDNLNPFWRGGYALALTGFTRSMDGEMFAPAMVGGIGLMVQQGHDHSLMLISKDVGAAGSPIPVGYPALYTDLRTVATLGVVNENPMTQLQGGALEFAGALYQRDMHRTFNSTTLRGGMYSDMSGAFCHSLHPMGSYSVRYYDPLPDYWGGIKKGGSWHGMARLGHPGQIQPFDGNWMLSLDSVAAPDPAVSRSTESSGFVYFSTANQRFRIYPPFDRYIGCQVTLDDVGDPAIEGIYTIINVTTTPPNPVIPTYATGFEVLGEKTLPDQILGGGEEMAILGSRWHYGYVDFGSFTMFGTEAEYYDAGAGRWWPLSPAQYPVLGAQAADLDVFSPGDDLDAGFGEMAWPFFGSITHSMMPPMVMMADLYGAGLRPLAAEVTNANWEAYPEPYINSGWGSFYREGVPGDPDAPFTDNLLGGVAADNIQNFWNSTWLWYRDGDDALPPLVYADTFLGNAAGNPSALRLRFGAGGDVASDPWTLPEDAIQLWGTPQRSIRLNHFEVTVDTEIQVVTAGGCTLTGDMDFEVVLENQDTGQTLGAGTFSVPIDDPPDTYTVVFANEVLREAPVTGLEDRAAWQIKYRLKEVVYGGGEHGGSQHTGLTVYIWRNSVYPKRTTLVEIGNKVVEGAHAAEGYRVLTPVQDWLVVGPSEASLFAPPGYAHEMPIVADGDYTDDPLGPGNFTSFPVEPQGRATVFAAPPEEEKYYFVTPAEDLVEFKQGRDAASIAFLTPYTDPKSYPGTTEHAPPGRIGFILPVRPPHGASMRELGLVMSFKPRINSENLPELEVWHQRGASTSGGGFEDRYGCRVRFCRSHLFPDQAPGGSGVTASYWDTMVNGSIQTNVPGPQMDAWGGGGLWPVRDYGEGFMEEIFTGYVDLGATNPAHGYQAHLGANTEGHDRVTDGLTVRQEIGAELFSHRRFMLMTTRGGGNVDNNPAETRALDNAFIADTRQYAYYVIVEAWGRGLMTSDGADIGNPDASDHMWTGLWTPWWASDVKIPGMPPWARMYKINPPDGADPQNSREYNPFTYTSMMKFRGLRLGYEWSRLRPG